MAKQARRQQRQHLNFAKRWLHITGKKREVFAAAANALELSWPTTSADGYALLAQFYERFRHSPSPSGIVTLRKRAKPAGINPNDDAFLLSYEWRKLRMTVLVKRGARCECCGATPKDGVRMHVDHIKPRRRHPELALTEANLQVLCEVCNHGKGSWDETDWRADSHIPMRDGHPCNRAGDGDGRMPVTTSPRLVKRTQEGRGDVCAKDETATKSA